MSFRASIREKYELWRAKMLAWRAKMLAAPEQVGPGGLTCSQCGEEIGEEIVVRWARNSDKAMAYHSLTRLWCPHSGMARYGATRAELAGEMAAEMGHGIVLDDGSPLFVATDAVALNALLTEKGEA